MRPNRTALPVTKHGTRESIQSHGQVAESRFFSSLDEGILGSGTCQIRSALQPALQLTPSTVLKAEGISRSTLEDSGASYLGHCWAMSGGQGFITVKLDRPVSPSQFVLEHAPPRISPSAGTSAPNKFRLIGWSGPVNDRAGKGSTTGEEELVSGAYLIDDSNSDSVFPHIQRFDVASAVSFLRSKPLNPRYSEV